MTAHSVLVIDHDHDVAEVVSAVLVDEGYRVTTLSDLSADAINAAIGRLEPDAVLLDGEDPSRGYGSSWQVAAALAKRERAVPVIMFTAHSADLAEARDPLTKRSADASFAAIVPKPFAVEDLIAAVARAVGVAVPFDASPAADATRTAALASALERGGARDVRASMRREWVTFRTPRGRLVQVYWWQTGGSYLIGRYDPDGLRLENVALTYDTDAAIEICASLIRAEALVD